MVATDHLALTMTGKAGTVFYTKLIKIRKGIYLVISNNAKHLDSF